MEGANTAISYQALYKTLASPAVASATRPSVIRRSLAMPSEAPTQPTVEWALHNNTTGGDNVANGFGALCSNTTGYGNIALDRDAGSNLTTGKVNIDIGNAGVACC